jgi:hypothetical protein
MLIIAADSGQDFLHDFAVNIGQAEVATEVAGGELQMVDAEQVEDGGMEAWTWTLPATVR